MKYLILVISFIYSINVSAFEQKPTKPSSLQQIVQSNELRVGTTGDYPPFSFSADDSAVFSGIDIDMATALATSKGLKVVFVKTTWPTLMADLKADKFDIAMSGISITPERAQQADFSQSYIENGKMLVVRCNDVKRFDHWSKIDNVNTQFIVNPGGTNESYAKSHLKNASLTIFDDNRKIFLEISAGRADAMITDAVEVFYQANLSNGVLCPAAIPKLSQGDIGILIQKDKKLTEFVNNWLKIFSDSGEKQALLGRYLGSYFIGD